MENKEFDVKTGKPLKVVGSVTVPIYENVDELVAAEPPALILSMFNNANKVRIMGNERQKHQKGKMGKNKRRELGFELLPEVLGEDAFLDLVRQANYEKMQAAIDSVEVQLAIDEHLKDDEGEVEETDEE